MGYVTTGYRRPVFSIRIRSSGLPLSTQGKSRMRECRTYGSVRGVGGNAHPYRDSVGALEHGMILSPSSGQSQTVSNVITDGAANGGSRSLLLDLLSLSI